MATLLRAVALTLAARRRRPGLMGTGCPALAALVAPADARLDRTRASLASGTVATEIEARTPADEIMKRLEADPPQGP
jgi:hypothetical protein